MAVRIMLVESSAKRRAEFLQVVKGSRFEVVSEAEDPISAIQLVNEVKPDIVVMAISFPTIGGIPAMSKLREFNKDAKLAIAYDQKDRHLLMEAVRQGAVACLKKPFKSEKVLKALTQAMSASGRGAGLQRTTRLAAKLMVKYKRADAGLFTWSTQTVAQDISPGGMAITATEPVREGTMLKIRVSLPGGEKIKASAKIMRTEKKREGLYQLGLQFVDISKENVTLIEDFIMRSVTSSGEEGEEEPGADEE